MSEALRLEGISHRYDDLVAVENLNLSIAPGEVTCLLGPSGCGKTTVLRIAAGLEPLQDGRIFIGGQCIADGEHETPPEARGVGLVFQDYALFPHLSVLDNVMFGLKGNTPAEDRRIRAFDALEKVKMTESAEAFPHTLSGGQQQRVALARALAPQPKVILLDEPYSGLDARLRDRVRDEVLHVLKESKAATLMVTHDSEEAMFMADSIAVMQRGSIVQSGAPAELYCQPVSAFVAAFFGEVNKIDAVVNNGMVETPVGVLPASGISDEAPATVVVRPEAIRLESGVGIFDDDDRTGTVIQSRLLGRTSMVHISMESNLGEDEEPLHLHARMPGLFLPKAGNRVRITLDRTQTFVFAG